MNTLRIYRFLIMPSKSLLEIFATFFSISKEERKIKNFFNDKKFRFNKDLNSPIIYVDAIQTPNTLIALSYFLPEYYKKHKARAVAYRHINKKPYNSITNNIRHKFSVLRKIGVEKIEIIAHVSQITDEVKILYSQIRTKKDLESFKYHGIYIGDLIYDSYLNEMRLPTINLLDPNLLRIFTRCIEMVKFWEAKIQVEKILAICVNHTVYFSGIPLRVAIFSGVEVFQVTTESIYRMNTEKYLAHHDYFDYPEEFANFSEEFQFSAREKARQKLEMRLSGQLTSDLFYMQKSSFAKVNDKSTRVLKYTNKRKILIATHDFYDSPHCYGNSFYPDFLEWLNALGDIAKQTDYEWYIKNHPSLRGNGLEIIKEFSSRFPNVTLIEPTISHHQLIEEGISVVTTVYGSIALEYGYLGLQVVNACPTNPHCRYNFSSTPKNAEEYLETIRNLDKSKFSVDRNEVLEFYYMHFLNYPQNWVFKNYDYYLSSTQGEGRKSLLMAFTHYLECNNTRSHSLINESIAKFLEGQSYRLKLLESVN